MIEREELYVGVMSGTSVDGIDVVVADFAPRVPVVLAHAQALFEPALRAELLALNHPGEHELARAALAASRLADAIAETVGGLLHDAGLSRERIRAVAVHGQTVRHRPAEGYSVQLNAPARIAEALGLDVIADFRSRDIAAGGQGAPLVPAFHAEVFGAAEARAIVNVGGIANVTLLPGSAGGTVLGFDCGPGNALLDGWTERHLGAPFDRDGAWARQGAVDPQLLDALLDDPYFAAPPPKSTGRDYFNEAWLRERLPPGHDPADVQATLLELTARSIVRSIDAFGHGVRRVLVCGGGARNARLLERLSALAAGRVVESTHAVGIDPQQVEALAFAWLGRRFVLGQPGNLPDVTGARGFRVLGARYPG